MREKPLPLVTSFYAPAIAADMAGYGRVYCVICDAEVNRAWVAENPRESKITYLAPCGRAVRRLNEYGIPNERIWLTGFPIPLELLGDENLSVLKWDLGQRLRYLDPTERFWPLHGLNVQHFLGAKELQVRQGTRRSPSPSASAAPGRRPTSPTRWRAASATRSPRERSTTTSSRGSAPRSPRSWRASRRSSPSRRSGSSSGKTLDEYFRGFTECMRTTDMLWTKPSELSFYCGLGIPVIMAPHIGSQEDYNQAWLLEIQAGFPQQDPQYTDQWLLDLVKAGRLADAAWNGFLKARKYGTYKIHEILQTGTMERETSVLRR